MHYKDFLSKDKKLKNVLKHEIVIPEQSKNITQSLISSIMGQQLSVQVARVMKQRFLDLYDGKFPKPEVIMKTPVAKIKGIGISQSKANYIHNVARFCFENKVTPAKLSKMSDEEIIEFLTEIKGVGRWTVEMLLIFGLKREDVFAVDDLGIQKGMIKLFKLQDLPKKELRLKMIKLSEKWSPYRSYICLHLWRFADSKE
jgi:DNA-3-methyladenine glycosylase II